MMLRARHLFLAWLAYGALQLALLGVAGVSGGQVGVGARGPRPQTDTQSVSPAKRLLAPDVGDRRTPLTPFAPSAPIRLDVSSQVALERASHQPQRPAARDVVALPAARAPPPLS